MSLRAQTCTTLYSEVRVLVYRGRVYSEGNRKNVGRPIRRGGYEQGQREWELGRPSRASRSTQAARVVLVVEVADGSVRVHPRCAHVSVGHLDEDCDHMMEQASPALFAICLVSACDTCFCASIIMRVWGRKFCGSHASNQMRGNE